MSETTSYFLVPASSGLCIEPKRGGMFTSDVEGTKQQQWQVEQGDDGKIAFRNVASGDYLRALGGGKGAKVGMGKKQFFTLESSSTPNAYWIRCSEFANAFLCNSYGKYNKDNTIWMWANELNFTQTMLWYISDFETWTQQKGSEPSVQFSTSGSRKRKPSGSLTRLTEIENREKDAEERKQRLDAQEKEMSEKQKQFDESKKVAEAQQTDLEAKDKAAQARQKDLDAKEKAAEAKLKDLDTKKKAAEAKQKELDSKEKAAVAKQKDLETKEQNLKTQKSGGSGGKTTNTESSDQVADLQRRLDESQTQLEESRNEHDKAVGKMEEMARREKEMYAKRRDDQTTPQQGSDGIVARRVQSSDKEWEAASVGRRDRPAGFGANITYLSPQRGPGKGIVMPKDFIFLPRLK